MKYQIKKLLINNFDYYEENKLPGRSYFIPYTDKATLSKKTALDERYGSDMVSILSGEWEFKYYEQISRLPNIIDTENITFSYVMNGWKGKPIPDNCKNAQIVSPWEKEF